MIKTEKKAGGVNLRKTVPTVVIFLILAAVAFIMLYPLILMIMYAFLPPDKLLQMSLTLNNDWTQLTLENFKTLFAYRDGEFFLWYKNSLIIMVIQTILGLALSSLVGYGLGMYNFKLKKLVFFLVMMFLMTPFEILMIPLYKECFHLGILNTYAGVLLPSIVTPFMVFFFMQTASGLPKELADAARVDGCGELRIFVTIMAPLMSSAYGAMGIMQALNSWNSFMWPLLVLTSSTKITLPIGIAGFVSTHGDTYDVLLSSAVCALLPVLILFLLFQKAFIAGLTVGGVKE